MIICKKFAEKAKNDRIKYIISDPNDFLTLGKALINNIRNRSYVKYGNNVLKFYEFIYSDNVPDLPEAHEPSCIMFHIENELLVYNMKSIIGETFIINYWLPKFDGKPVFYSDIDHSTPLGLIYSIVNVIILYIFSAEFAFAYGYTITSKNLSLLFTVLFFFFLLALQSLLIRPPF